MSVKGTAPRPRPLSVRELRARLAEAEQTLHAIQGGEVDAFVVHTRHGDQVFTLQGAEHPYRVLVEQMEEGAATVSTDGTILYANRCLGVMLGTALERLVGASFMRASARRISRRFVSSWSTAAAERTALKRPCVRPTAPVSPSHWPRILCGRKTSLPSV